MYLHTDGLAALVGYDLRNERKDSRKYRIPEILDRLFKPAKTLLNALDSTEFSREFLVTWSQLKDVDTDLLTIELKKLLGGIPKHIEIIKKSGVKGKHWDSDLKVHFIKKVAFLCEFVDPAFQPTVKSLKRPAYILAKPLFDRDSQTEQFLESAIVKCDRMFRRGNDI
jgi:hypothetical protein